jgi:hypothetical protein
MLPVTAGTGNANALATNVVSSVSPGQAPQQPGSEERDAHVKT